MLRTATRRAMLYPTAAAAAAGEWWDVTGVVAAWQPKGAADYASSLVDISGNGNDATEGVAPSWDATNGWTFNGSTQWLSTGINQGQDLTTVLRVSDWASGIFFGSRGDPRTYFEYNAAQLYNFGNAAAAATIRASGVYALAGPSAYYNGSSDGTVTDTWAGSTLTPMAIGGMRRSTSTTNFASIKIQAAAIYSRRLTPGEVATLSAAMAAL